MVWALLFAGLSLCPGQTLEDLDAFGDYDPLAETEEIADPLEPLNRLTYRFNDAFYHRLFKPVARRYNRAIPKPARESVERAFQNLRAPPRFVNALLRGRLRSAGTVMGRFALNSTVGVLGLLDPAESAFGLPPQSFDTAHTLEVVRVPEGWYLVLPFLGPSTVRDTVGLVADNLMIPRFLVFDAKVWLPVTAVEYTNRNALRLGQYESLTESAIEPYFALRSAYVQHRGADETD